MSKHVLVIILGLVVATMPFLGFPSTWETVILVALGVSISVLAFLVRQTSVHGMIAREAERARDVYVENGTRSSTSTDIAGGNTNDQKAT